MDSEFSNQPQASPPVLDPIDYPFDIPSESYLWSRGSIAPLREIDEIQTAGRIAVLAVGSNASPSQLSRKFLSQDWINGNERESQIPVVKVTVPGIDVVYAAHLAGYGSLPATVVADENATATVFLTWLTVRQFHRMNETERLGSTYLLRTIDHVNCGERVLDGVYCYVSSQGAVLFQGAPFGLSEFEVTGGAAPRGSQRETWELLATELNQASGRSLLSESLQSDDTRALISEYLSRERAPLSTESTVHVLPVTSGSRSEHHSARNHPYVVVISPKLAKQLRISELAEVGCTNGGRCFRSIAYVVLDDQLSDEEVLLDQTLRAALGIQRVTSSGPLGFVTMRPLKLNLWQRIADKMSWIGGRRYLLLRICPPDPPDIEKNLCRIEEDDLGSLAVASGDHVLLLSPIEGRLKRRSLQALRLGESDQEARNALVQPTWSARYPDAPVLLNIENRNDLRPIWLDRDARAKLGLQLGDAVLARRSLPTAVLNQILDFGVVLLAAVLALKGLIPDSPVLAVTIGVAVTIAVVIARLRTKLS